MKGLRFLKTFTDILYTLLTIIVMILIPFLLVLVISPETITFKFMDVAATDIPAIEIALLFLAFISILIELYALSLFRKTLVHFRDRQFFDAEVITNFNRIGLAIIAGHILCYLPWYLYDSFDIPVLPISDSIDWITDTLVTLALGLFFIVLSEVFRSAKQMKQENDLTI